MNILVDYHWPGNVRELQNIVERGCGWLRAQPSKSPTFISTSARQGRRRRQSFPADGMTLEQWEDEMIQEALRRANGNKSQAARLLGLSRNAFAL